MKRRDLRLNIVDGYVSDLIKYFSFEKLLLLTNKLKIVVMVLLKESMLARERYV